MQKQNLLRTFLFILFFSIGAAAITASILCDEILQYYRNKQLLKYSQESLDKLQSLNIDYDILLQQLKADPNLVKRIAPAVLGTQPPDANEVYPKVTIDQLLATRDALKQKPNQLKQNSEVPGWLNRCMKPAKRSILFIAGAFLILICFICFGKPKPR